MCGVASFGRPDVGRMHAPIFMYRRGGGGDGRDAYDDETLPPPHGAIAATSNGVSIFCRSAPYTFQGTAAQQQHDAERSGRAERITSVLIAALLARPIRRLEAIYPGIPCDAP